MTDALAPEPNPPPAFDAEPAADIAATRRKIDDLEGVMRCMPQAIIPTLHHFTKGIYAREIRIPAGATLTGKIHRTWHLNILAAGDISVMTEDGIRRLQAPQILVSPPGTKRVGHAHADCVWITIHGTDETDLAALEDQLIAPSHDDALGAPAAPPAVSFRQDEVC